jgi:hypothetical protein
METALFCGHLRARRKNKRDRVSLVRKLCAQNIPKPKYKSVHINCIELATMHEKLLYVIRTHVLNSGITPAHIYICSYHTHAVF